MPTLENARSVGVNELVQMDVLEPAKKLFPVGMVALNVVYPDANRGLYAAQDEV